MKLTINKITDQGAGIVNEDTLLVGEKLFGVFDGATSMNAYQDEDGKTGGYLASNLVKDIFEKSDKDLIETTKHANKELQKKMEERKVDTTNPLDRWVTGLAVVSINEDSFNWAQISDCLILVIYKDGTHKLLVTEYDHDKETLTFWRRYIDTGDESFKEKFAHNRTRMRTMMNKEYGVISGQEEMIDFLNHGTESLEGVSDIVLFTDGLFVPQEDPEVADDFSAFKKLYLNGGLEKIKTHVRDLEKADPEKTRYPRFKVHDDIGAVSIHLS